MKRRNAPSDRCLPPPLLRLNPDTLELQPRAPHACTSKEFCQLSAVTKKPGRHGRKERRTLRPASHLIRRLTANLERRSRVSAQLCEEEESERRVFGKRSDGKKTKTHLDSPASLAGHPGRRCTSSRLRLGFLILLLVVLFLLLIPHLVLISLKVGGVA
jgi:hypothetical protein